jgi:DNA repair exonuclease SbcCD ATPase subunit
MKANGNKVLSNDQVNFAIEILGPSYMNDCITQNDLHKQLEFVDNTIKQLTNKCISSIKQIEKLDKRLIALESVIQPDKEDVYNIDRQIQLLARRISALENAEERRAKRWWHLW